MSPMSFLGWLRKLGPGLITGAADDDPSGIATYSQVGAQFGLNMLWAMLFTFPLMVAAQLISARIGRVTGYGIARNMGKSYPRWLVGSVVLLLFVANTINVAADIGAMGEALRMLIGGRAHLYTLCFGLVCVLLQIFLPYPRYVPFLKWLTLALFAYVATVFMVQVPWSEVLYRSFIPTVSWDAKYLVALTAVLGTTISPYLFFWQASHEAEEQRAASGDKPLKRAPAQARRQLTDSSVDTFVGMGFSNLIAYFIILSAAVTLHAHGVTDIQSTAQAAEALRPIAGDLTFWLFAAGIIGTGLLGVPVLAGSAAYGVGEALSWRVGLANKFHRARGFYVILALATLLGTLLNLTPIDPIKALFWSAVINGVLAAPVLGLIVWMATQHEIMGRFILRGRLKQVGWAAAAIMTIASVAFLWNLKK
jgi:NRAMP (natural resistance-associated macrophage protein)-like metal ion transporter